MESILWKHFLKPTTLLEGLSSPLQLIWNSCKYNVIFVSLSLHPFCKYTYFFHSLKLLFHSIPKKKKKKKKERERERKKRKNPPFSKGSAYFQSCLEFLIQKDIKDICSACLGNISIKFQNDKSISKVTKI